jgi:hypothetical protein
MVRVRLTSGVADSAVQVLDRWLARTGASKSRASTLLACLRDAGALTVLVAVPGDSALTSDAGFYVGGTPALTQEAVEDCLIMGAGLVGSACSVVPKEGDWFFVGLFGDGDVEGSNPDDASDFVAVLKKLDDTEFTVVFSLKRIARVLGAGDSTGVGPSEFLAGFVPSDDRRVARRLRALLNAADKALAITYTTAAGSEGDFTAVFETEAAAVAFEGACAGIRKDMTLALEGKIARGEVGTEEALNERRFIEAFTPIREGELVRFGS